MPPLSNMDAQDIWDDSRECSSSDLPLVVEKSISPPTASSSSKKVSFASSVSVMEMESLRDIPSEEIAATWYNNVEFERIKKSMIVTLRFMVAKRPLGADQCSRGLEMRTPEGSKLRKKNKINALTAVWHAQVANWDMETVNEEAISTVYQVQSANCKHAARRAAIYDEQAARLYQGLTVSQPQQIEAALFENLVAGSSDRRKAVREDIKQLVDSDKQQPTHPKKSSCAPSAA